MLFPLFAPTVLLGEVCPRERRVALAEVDHGPFSALLARFVDDHGRVAYAAWKADAAAVGELHVYLNALGRADVDAPAAKDAALAFWINTYNALTLAGVLHVYPTTSIRNHTGRVFGFNIWKNLRLHLGDRTLSLSEIEHGVLRALNDPRVHFGLVCASNGCPALPNRAYAPGTVNQQLDDGARAFLARPDTLRIDPETQLVSLSKLFKWYGDDFGSTPAERLAALRRFLPANVVVDQLGEAETLTEYLPYDWKLNDQAGSS